MSRKIKRPSLPVSLPLINFMCRKAFYTDKKEAKKGNVIQQT
ncbi:hypothetical protein IRB23M11_01290 [Alkalibacterium sp. m-11]